MPTGTLQIFTSLADEALPLSNVILRVFKVVNDIVVFETYLMSDSEGQSPVITLETKSKELSLDETYSERPYEIYSVECMLAGYTSILVQGVQIFEGDAALLPISMVPDILLSPLQVDTTPDHHLLTNYGGNNVSMAPTRQMGVNNEFDSAIVEEGMLKTPERISFALNGVVIPRQIRVHLGRPTSNAENVTVDFIYYIKNVCCSEIYPTWPREALLANIHAQVSLALNRVYTEWYRSKGYDFDITNNTAFDQAFVKNRNIFENISELVDDVFNQFLRKRNYAEPFYAEYCDGKIADCPGMKQWGTLTLANQGLSAIEILQYYYTPEVRLVTTERIEDVKGSYSRPLRLGSEGDDVHLIQQQLNAISVNYPIIRPIYPVDGIFGPDTEAAVRTFQKQFNLTVDGVVGKSTWYKINYIYVAVRKLAELSSIGRVENDKSGEWPQEILKYGDRNVYVQQLQYYLSTIATFNNAISSITTIDSFFGQQTANAVRSFQRFYGLDVDGIVGEVTWNRIYAVYLDMVHIVNPDIQAPVYPGIAVKQGATGQDVLEIQQALNTVGMEYPEIVVLIEDGIFGARTTEAVREFQRLLGLEVDGIVGPNTWTKLFEASNAIMQGNNASPSFPTYPGTPLRLNSRGNDVRLIQDRLNFISIYYKEIPSVAADGIFGPRTQQSVIAFQNLLGLTPDGIVGQQTWNRINQVYQELNQ